MKVVTALMLAAVLVGVASAQEVKIGYVDLQRALNESEAGKKAKEDFKGQVDKLQNELKKQRDDVDRLKDQIEKKSLVLKDEERRNLQKDYERKMRDFERSYKDSQTELQSKDNDLTGAILRELQLVIQDYGERQGYLIILEASSNVLLYGAKSGDLTDKIIEVYNGSHERKKK